MLTAQARDYLGATLENSLAEAETDAQYFGDLWRAVADAVGIKEGSRIGTHSFRRAFANRLRDVALRELKDLGGWKTEQTVIGTYLQPDQDAQRAALDRL
jgi:integrase